MGGWSLRSKFTGMVVLLIAITTAVLWLVLPVRLGEIAYETFADRALSTTSLVAHSAERAIADGRDVGPALEAFRDADEVLWVQLLGPDLEPLVRLGEAPRVGRMAGEVGLVDGVAVTQLGVPMPGGEVALIQAGWSLESLAAGKAEHRRVALGVSLLWLVLGVAFAQFGGMLLIAPISRVADAARRVADGDTSVEAMGFTASPEWRLSADETQRLRAAVQDMACELGQRFEVAQAALQTAEIAQREAADASAMKSSFLANMSHELRTPLNAVIGYTELLAEECAEIEGAELLVGDLARIESSSRHLLGLINNILDLAKVESGKMELCLEDIDVRSVLDDTLETARPLVRPGVVLESSFAPGVASFRTDGTRLRQITLNLLSNAAKFTSHGRIMVSVVQRDGELVLEVADTGIGMDEAQQKSVFDAFVQARASTSRDYGGTGLGLALVREFSRMLGGSVEVESEQGQGTTFRVTLMAA